MTQVRLRGGRLPLAKKACPPAHPSTRPPGMAGTVRDLKVWQEAVALAAETVRSARQSAKRETKVITDHIMLSALSAAGAIADGYGRYTAPEQRQLYRTAKRELLRLETQLAVARQADLMSAHTHADLSARIQGVNRLLGGYLVYLERQLESANQTRDSAQHAQ
jgi:four helix bundle protein